MVSAIDSRNICSLFGIVGVTDKCLEALSKSCSNTITTLDVNGCIGIKKRSREELLKLFPHVGCFKVHSASSGILLGAVTLPGLAVSKLIQLRRGLLVNEVTVEVNDVVRSKRSTRNSGNEGKQSAKNTSGVSKSSLGVKKGSKKNSGKNRNFAKGMEGVEFEGNEAKEMEAKNDDFEGSDGENEATVVSSSQGLTGSEGESSFGAKTHISVSLSSDVCGDIPVPFVDNPVLNPGISKTNVTSKVDSDKNMNVGGMSNHWPSLNETKDVSFASAFKGLTGYGNNKLLRVPVRINDQGRKVVNAKVSVSLSSDVCGDIPVPFVDNPVLNPGISKTNVTSKVDSDKNMNVGGMSNHWPSLNETVKHMGSKGESGVQNKNDDTVMTENLVKKDVSFASAFKGLTGYGNNKLLRVPYKSCSFRVVTGEDKVEKAKDDGATNAKFNETSKGGEEWQEARRFTRNEASSSRYNGQQSNDTYGNRGGFSSRGRGGYIGRGGMTQRGGNEGINMRFIPVESGVRKVDECLIMDGKNKNTNMNKGKGVADANNKTNNHVKQKKDISVKNSFDVLAKESMDSVDIGSDEWVQLRSKIDLSCKLGMEIVESEKTRWSKDLVKYYKDKCNEKAKQKLMEGLRWRIAKLQKDISYGHNNTVMNAKMNADELWILNYYSEFFVKCYQGDAHLV
ncbi:hypothetical protein CTI12_AA183950 [Artemisia annua]|uniref:Uncharacterized protein n=1 Tax=Artemisia annua TaxID=35608 RepID=A0A2U1P7L9_ARTAN|nr:hypothetical protein CTI12_AA183950 [Artemisia annua]